MEATKYDCPVVTNIKHKKIFNLRNLRKSLKFRPEIYRLILKMRLCVKKKSRLIKKLKHDYETAIGKTKVTAENKYRSIKTDVKTTERTTQTDEIYVKKKLDNTDIKSSIETTETPQSNSVAGDSDKQSSPGWIISDDAEKSIADQVKEVAQNVIEESGMVYVESAGMYYDYKTGYYYSPDLGLYYHTDTGCYYYYSNENKTFVFHSYPDKSAQQVSAPPKQIKKAKKHKKTTTPEDVDNLTESLSQDENKSERKRRKLAKNKMESNEESASKEDKDSKEEMSNGNATVSEDKDENKEELEDGECSDSGNEVSDVDSDISTSTASDDETVSKHHPPCMRIIIRETNLPKLKVGSLYLITKDGGTIGREGEQHALVIKDHNVSRSHLDIRYDMDRKAYFAVDVGSKNGTILNGIRMSESTVTSQPLEVVHGSVIQLGETKLLCHVHPGTDTCGHCEPGLIMETEEKEKKMAYTRTCSVQRQHQLELARLKNLYAPAPLAIMDTEYNDRARARREQVGSSHSAEKTQASDIDTCIASENKGFKLLEKMGWSKGEGLGKDNQGDTEPIPLISNEGKTGLGATPTPTAAGRVSKTLGPATMRLASKTKMLRPPAKAFQQPVEEDSE